ncbi:uncharacterized protein LOC143854854 [Tasmannia lanceolata]|uniref:uncharacterized protein LOC143854854 n=1 Tax=Tasmannia lanceolata TaxID=3420 RepID=UPI0040630C45
MVVLDMAVVVIQGEAGMVVAVDVGLVFALIVVWMDIPLIIAMIYSLNFVPTELQMLLLLLMVFFLMLHLRRLILWLSLVRNMRNFSVPGTKESSPLPRLRIKDMKTGTRIGLDPRAEKCIFLGHVGAPDIATSSPVDPKDSVDSLPGPVVTELKTFTRGPRQVVLSTTEASSQPNDPLPQSDCQLSGRQH